MIYNQWMALIVLALCLAITFSSPSEAAAAPLKIVDAGGKTRDIEALITDLSSARAVFIGEEHDEYDHHLSQLEIIRRLSEHDPNRWVIGVEWIQRRFQLHLDAYIAGTISEGEFLKQAEYFDRWGFDFRLYRPIFSFAKERGIHMVALNAEEELTKKVARVGLEGLESSGRAQIPRDIDKSDETYRKRLEKIFKEHPESTNNNFEHFLETQLVWDETMADSAAQYLSNHPDKAMVVLAGAGHIEYGFGIPNRVRRRLPQSKTTILLAETAKAKPKAHMADYYLVSTKEILPPAPKMGIVMSANDGAVSVKQITPRGAAAASGMMVKDRIAAVDDQVIKSIGDVRLALRDKRPGDRVILQIQRNEADRLTIELQLQ